MGEKITYRCTLCPPGEEYEDTDRANVMRHASKSKSGRHEDASGSDHGVIEEIDLLERETVEANPKRWKGDEDVKIESKTGSYTGPADGLDMTMQHISERPGGKGVEVDAARTVLVPITEEDALALLASDAPENTRLRVLRAISVFDEDE